ncbi:hypothetical protein POJ06DRAFT_152207 [Lipomyces tetrasporus]|uniref:Uncharacterized protein n=1 Tax=Lipomyces tetrasporus TaxID=54092 RepID=A0AAD7QNH6_9ASCO|nr:uncharacterized protein POJ06DRAFT_152207 [Lipomyces tetrasporus]KAJ8098488.1 hypothetical protein POJ06DRAFT_152207 [Lipomyces tetrasporus]
MKRLEVRWVKSGVVSFARPSAKGCNRLSIARTQDATTPTTSSYYLGCHVEDMLYESDDEDQRAPLFNPPAFRPGSAPLRRIPVQDGFKCQLCAQKLHHVCVTTKESTRTHYKRNHKGQAVEYYEVKVQAFYGRSRSAAQLRYVQVKEREDQDEATIAAFGIPENIHSVPSHKIP